MDVEFAGFLGLTAWQWLDRRWWSWIFPITVLAGAVLGNGWTVLWFGGFGLSYARLLDALRQEAQHDRNQLTTEVFLQRLRQHLVLRGNLTSALAEVVLPSGVHRSEPVRVLDQLAVLWQSEPLKRFSTMAVVSSRHGGSLVTVMDDLLHRLVRDRQRRHGHRAEEAAQRSSIVILGVLPIPMYLSLYVFAPTFYRILEGSVYGHVATTWVAMTTVVANEILRWQVTAH